jgi:DMSO/TMAO reductase YedYZ heme-binding membrane subunit
VQKDVREPMAYAVVLGALLLVRLVTSWRLRAATALADVKGAPRDPRAQ